MCPSSTSSACVTLGYRASGLLLDDEIVWFWTGTHAAYGRLLENLSLRYCCSNAHAQRPERASRAPGLLRGVGRLEVTR